MEIENLEKAIEAMSALLQKKKEEEFNGKKYKGFTLFKYKHRKSYAWQASQSLGNKKHVVHISKKSLPYWKKKVDQYIDNKGLMEEIEKKFQKI